MNEEIEKIFNRKIKIDNKEIPIEYMDYQGKKEEYVIYFNNGSLPFFEADDKVMYKEMNLEFHIYSKGNYLKIVDYIKEKMEENDFSWQSDEGDKYESDTKYHHFISNFKKIVYRREK
jgi:hypothetical protein